LGDHVLCHLVIAEHLDGLDLRLLKDRKASSQVLVGLRGFFMDYSRSVCRSVTGKCTIQLADALLGVTEGQYLH